MSMLLCARILLVVFTTMLMRRSFVGTSGLRKYSVSLHKRTPPKVCSSVECKTINENWLRKVDVKKDPCEDFYSFACGRYTDPNTEIDMAVLKVKKQLLDILTGPSKENDHKSLKMMKQIYKSCYKHDSNIQDLKNLIFQLGGWSLDPNWKEKDFSLAKFYAKSIEIGYLPTSLFIIDVNINPETRQNIFIIKPKPDTSTGRIQGRFQTSRFLHSSIVAANYHDYIFKTFASMLVFKMNISYPEVLDELSRFERMSKLIHDISGKPSQPTRVKIKEAQRLFQNLRLVEILAIVNPFKMSDHDIVQLDCPKCLSWLDGLLRNTSTKSLAAYMIWSFIIEYAKESDNVIMNDWLEYNYGQKGQDFHPGTSRQNYCVDKVSNLFGRVMDYEYVNHYFDKKLIPTVQNFVQKLKTAMVSVLESNTSMDSETRSRFIEKVKNMVFKIAYFDEIENGQALQYYDNLNLNPKSYLLSLINIMKFTMEKLLKNLGKPAKLPYLETTSGSVQYLAYYNTVFLPVNVLTSTLYTKENRPQYLNFGGLGFIIAHEMNHAFDITGRTLDKYGTLNKTWWPPETIKKEWQRSECIANHYSTLINPETRHEVNGVKTLSENYADIGGIEVAYKAYNEVRKDSELLLPSFQSRTFNQLFWITFATAKCSKPSKKEILYREKDDQHALELIRVNGVVMNSKDFSTDWACRENTPMNPTKKCSIWK